MKAPLVTELRARREALGLSAADVGERCGIDERLLHDWERGIGSPQLDAVETWAAVLGVALGLMGRQPDSRTGVRIDWDERRITVDGTPVRLTPMEWKALERLARVPGELVTHEALFHHLYGDDRPYRAQSTAIRVLITKLRRLLPLRIDARWGRGYVVSGVEPQSPDTPADPPTVATPPARPAPGKAPREGTALAPDHSLRNALQIHRNPTDTGHPGMTRVAPSAVRPNPCRAEELGVIERFLSERGVTRCPDVATIQHAPLPTLVWDKMKRKWVRPSVSAHEASQSA